jgi:eukaryotic-like serine/threonine-protein kinase
VRFGRYLLDRRLAIGGMAEVFLGRIEGPEGFEKRVVIKRILPHLQDNENHVQMFLDEARLAARFNHPNLVQVYELARIDNQYCLAMEYIEGEDVAAILDQCLRQKRRLPFGVLVYIVTGAAEGLQYAHGLLTPAGAPLNVVHRDISPANIIVTWRGGVKIVDFGIAKHEISTTETMAGTIKGKFSYMSPEQARGEQVDRRSDLFSLGTILYEMITVTPCFAGANQIEILDAVTRVRYRSAKNIRPDLPASVERILKGLLTAKRDQRYPSAEALLRDLKQLGVEHNIPSSNEVGAYLENLFGRKQGGSNPTRVPTSIQRLDELPVTDELSSPELIADSGVYQLLVDSQIKKIEIKKPAPQVDDEEMFDIDSGLLRLPSLQRRRSTLSRVADRLREPRYWPSTLAIIAVAMVLSASALAMVYRYSLGLPWRLDEILSEVLVHKSLAPTVEEDVGAGALQVMSEPPGASVSVDGERIEGRTPMTVDNLALGMPHHVVAEMQGYDKAARDISLTDSALVTVTFNLPRATPTVGGVEVEVTSTPSGAAISVDGTDAKKTTPAIVSLPPGSEHLITAHLEGYTAKGAKVTPEAGKKTAVDVGLTALAGHGSGLLDLDSEPTAEVSIDGRVMGNTPLRKLSLPAGPVVVKIHSNKLGVSKTIKLAIVKGETLQRNVVFGKGQLVFDVRPWADVYMGGKKLGTTPMPPVSLYEGTYAIKLVNSELGIERVVQATVRAGKTKKVIEKMR